MRSSVLFSKLTANEDRVIFNEESSAVGDWDDRAT